MKTRSYNTFGGVSWSFTVADVDRLRCEGFSCWSRWRLRTAVAATAADTMAVAANCTLGFEVKESILQQRMSNVTDISPSAFEFDDASECCDVETEKIRA